MAVNRSIVLSNYINMRLQPIVSDSTLQSRRTSSVELNTNPDTICKLDMANKLNGTDGQRRSSCQLNSFMHAYHGRTHLATQRLFVFHAREGYGSFFLGVG